MELTLAIDIGADAEASELEATTQELRRELLDLDVDDVAGVSAGPAPPGTRAVDAAILGTLLVTAGQGVIGAVVRTLEGWLARRPERSVKLQIGDDAIEISNVSAAEQRELLDAFLTRHASKS